MNTRSPSYIKAILVMGVLAFAFLFLSSHVLRLTLRPNERERVIPTRNASPFDGKRAMATLHRISALGPRPTGSEAAAACRAIILADARAAGFQAAEQSFGPGAENAVSVVAKRAGARPGHIVLFTHYDTIPAEPEFTGANSDAAGAAWLLELARVLPGGWVGRTLWLVWMDARHGGGTDPEEQAGARAFLRWMEEQNAGGPGDAAIYVAAVGDCYLGIPRDAGAPPWMADAIRETAERLLYANHFQTASAAIPGPHTVFREAGWPALAVVDTVHGGSPVEHRRLWHTVLDQPDMACAASLQAAGDVIYHALPALDERLDQAQGRP